MHYKKVMQFAEYFSWTEMY